MFVYQKEQLAKPPCWDSALFSYIVIFSESNSLTLVNSEPMGGNSVCFKYICRLTVISPLFHSPERSAGFTVTDGHSLAPEEEQLHSTCTLTPGNVSTKMFSAQQEDLGSPLKCITFRSPAA